MRSPTSVPRDYRKGTSSASPSLVSVLGSPTGFRSVQSGTPSLAHIEIPVLSASTPRRQPGTPLSTRSQDLANTPNKTKGTPSKASMKKPQRALSASKSKSFRNDASSPDGRARPTPSRSNSDRFIPNRSQMRVDICRASILSAEKSRLEAIDKKASGETSRDASDVQSPANGNASTEILTPIQSEYRARLRGTLLNLSADGIHGSVGSRTSSTRSSTGRTNERPVTSSGFHSVTPSVHSSSDELNLAYANMSSESCNGWENIDPCGRMLSFRSSLNDSIFSAVSCFGDNPALTTPSRRTKSSIAVTPDPYSHDQLHVFDRSGRSSMFVDPAFETALRDSSSKTTRKINSAPTRILDAPELVDDYYLNLISWGKDNILAVALGQCVYLWNATTGDIQHLLTLSGEEDFVTSVRWADLPGHTNYLAVGTNDGPVQLWDGVAMKKIRTMRGHAARVGSLSWTQHTLSSGGRDSVIIQHDVRSASHIVSTYAGHTQEVCGLEWNEDGTTLASGGNENYLCIWDAAMSMRRSNNGRSEQSSNRGSPRLLLTQHQAAVKALAWCPFHRGLLASGGGTADRTIKFWNSNSGALLNSIDTGSQVCSLLWSKHQRELCSSHGFSENQLILWRYPTMTKIQEFKGHTARVSFVFRIMFPLPNAIGGI